MLEFLKKHLPKDAKIKCVALTGSSVYSNEPHDLDYFVLFCDTDKNYIYLKDSNKNIDYFCYNEKYWKNLLSFKIINKYSLNVFFEMTFKKNIIYGNDDIEFDLLSCRNDYIKMLKEVLPLNICNPYISSLNNTPLKRTVAVLIPLFWIENGKYELSEEQQKIVEKAHQEKLDWEWIKWIKRKVGLEENK